MVNPSRGSEQEKRPRLQGSAQIKGPDDGLCYQAQGQGERSQGSWCSYDIPGTRDKPLSEVKYGDRLREHRVVAPPYVRSVCSVYFTALFAVSGLGQINV